MIGGREIYIHGPFLERFRSMFRFVQAAVGVVVSLERMPATLSTVLTEGRDRVCFVQEGKW